MVLDFKGPACGLCGVFLIGPAPPVVIDCVWGCGVVASLRRRGFDARLHNILENLFPPSLPSFLPSSLRGDCMAAERRNGKFAYLTRGYVARKSDTGLRGSLAIGRLVKG